MAPGGGDVDGPMAGAADVGLAALFERLEGADPVALVVDTALGRLDHLLEDVIEALVAEIVFLLRDPFLKAEMRLDDEFRHVWRLRSRPRVSQALRTSEAERARCRAGRTRIVWVVAHRLQGSSGWRSTEGLRYGDSATRSEALGGAALGGGQSGA